MRRVVFSQSSKLAVFSRSNHCVKSVCIRNFSVSYFPTFGLNTENRKIRGIRKGHDTLDFGFPLEFRQGPKSITGNHVTVAPKHTTITTKRRFLISVVMCRNQFQYTLKEKYQKIFCNILRKTFLFLLFFSRI